jgi:hypothetical protein
VGSFRIARCCFQRTALRGYLSTDGGSRAGEKRIYLYVPVVAQGLAKKKGAQFDSDVKKWYITELDTKYDFAQWQILYLSVPFQQKDKAKKLGARWDKDEKKWYIPTGVPEEFLTHWLVEGPWLAEGEVRWEQGGEGRRQPRAQPTLPVQQPLRL